MTRPAAKRHCGDPNRIQRHAALFDSQFHYQDLTESHLRNASLAALLVALSACPGVAPVPPAAPKCRADADCTDPNVVCRKESCGKVPCGPSAACQAGETCTSGADPHCIVVPPATCQKDADCASGTLCRDKLCKPVTCSASAPCTAGEICDSGGHCKIAPSCQADADCPSGTGVCRDNLCGPVACPPTCSTGETCTSGQCVASTTPTTPATTSHTLAAGGSVSTSSKHIHIGITGQGRAVGASSSSTHQHVGGATAVLGR